VSGTVERNGSLETITGYDRESGILAGGGRVPDVPIEEAVELLLDVCGCFCCRLEF
jgi:hypothetical protein